MALALPIAGLVVAYLAGSTPNAWIAGKLLRGIDLRQHGSGNLGATNVQRILGTPAAIAVLLLDTAKGALPALLFASLFRAESSPWWAIGFGIAAIAGHVRPYFGLFKGGGKGVATSGGVFAAIAPAAFAVGFLVVACTVAITRYVSLASMAGAVAICVASVTFYGLRSPLSIVSLAVAAFVIWNHRANIGRLRRGEEARLGQRARPA
jgi:glycerol-3-phosphate acyltransferase PlsY